MKYLDLTLDDAAGNLACDEALLQAHETERLDGELLRVWEAQKYFVVLGHSNRIAAEVEIEACERRAIPVLRRMSGGGAVLQGPGCLNYSLILNGAAHRLSGDYIEAGSWAVIAAVTGGEIEIRGAEATEMEVVGAVLERLGIQCRVNDRVFTVEASEPRAAGRITTGLWPGFPSDMISLASVLATQAEGRTLVHDWLYELRLFALEQLSAMRAELFLCDSHRMIVTGRTRLKGRALDSRDLRSGMALVAAALAAEGESRISPVETIERGYAALVDRLRSLGAQVERESVNSR